MSFVVLILFLPVCQCLDCRKVLYSLEDYDHCGNCFCKTNSTAKCFYIDGEPILPQHITDLYMYCSDLKLFSARTIPIYLNLTSFHLRKSLVGKITEDAFVHHPLLTHLDVTSTKFDELSKLFGAMRKLNALKTLKLRDLSIQNFTKEVIEGISISDITLIDLQHNFLTEMNFDFFSSFESLRTLILRNNTITSLSGIAQLLTLKELDLHDNRLAEDEWSFCNDSISRIKGIKTLNVGGNSITHLKGEKLICLKDLEFLELSNNKMQSFEFKEIQPLGSLKTLILSNNWLKNVTGGYFPNSLQTVDLSKNAFSLFPPELCGNESTKQFSNLTVLNLSENLLKKLWIYKWQCLPNLVSIDFSHNLIETIAEKAFERFKSLTSLRLDHNNLKFVKSSCLRSESLKYLSIGYNWLRFYEDSLLDVFEFCPHLTQLNLSYSALGQLCDENLTAIFSHIENLTDLDLRGCKFNRTPVAILRTLPSLKNLKLDRNYLTSLHFSDNYTNLEYLSVADNKIQTVDAKTFSSVISGKFILNLKWNPFYCGCKMRWFRNSIDERGYIGSISLEGWPNGYVCRSDDGTKKFVNKQFRDFHLTNKDCEPLSVIILVFAAVGSAIFVMVAITCCSFRYRWYIQFVWHNFKKAIKSASRHGEKRYLIDGTKYDFYVLSHDDAVDNSFVEHSLRKRFEDQLHYKLFLWNRDAEVGAPKVDIVLNAMDASKSVLVVVTEKLMKSDWDNFLVDVAVSRSFKTKPKKVFFVLLDKVNKNTLSKSWCVYLTKLPGAVWCNENESIRNKLFDEEVKYHLNPRKGQRQSRSSYNSFVLADYPFYATNGTTH